MTTYSIQGPDGKTYTIDGPEGASKEDVIAAIQRKSVEASTPRDYTLGELVGKGFTRGAKQIGSALGDVLPAMVGSAVGADEYAKRQMAEAAGTQEEIARKYAPQYGSTEDIHGVGDALKYALESVAEQGPNIATSIIPGVGGAGVAGALARRGVVGAAETAAKEAGEAALTAEAKQALLKESAAEIAKKQAMGMNLGVYLGSFSQNTPEVFQNIYNQTGELAPGAALLAGSISSALDSALPAYILKKITGPAKVGLIEKILEDSGMQKGIIRKAVSALPEAAAMEGLTEGTQEAISMAAEQFISQNKDVFNSEGWNRIIESAIKGAVVGGVFGGTSGAIEGAKEKFTKPITSSDQQPAPGTEPAPTDLPPTTPLSPTDAIINKALFVDEDLINTLGLPKNAGIVKRIKDLEINQENATVIKAELSKYQGDDVVKENINKLFDRPEFQGVQIGQQPRGTRTTGSGDNISVSDGSTTQTTTGKTKKPNGAGAAGVGVDATELNARVEGSEAAETNTLTKSALDLLKSVAEGGVPAIMTNNLRKIAIANGIKDITPAWTPNQVIEALQAKLDAAPAAPTVKINKASEVLKKEPELTPEELAAANAPKKQTKYDYSGITPLLEQAHKDGIISTENLQAAKKMMENDTYSPAEIAALLENSQKQREAGVTGTGKKLLPPNQQKAANVWNSVSNRVKFDELVPEDQATIVDAHNNNRIDRDLVDEIVEGGGYLDYSTKDATKDMSIVNTMEEHVDIHDAIKGSKTLGQALKNVLDKHSDMLLPAQAKLINRLLNVRKAVNAKFNHSPTKSSPLTTDDRVAVGHYTQNAHEVTLWQEGGLKTLLHEAVHAAAITEMYNHIVKSARRDGNNYVKDARGRLIWDHKVKNNSPIGKQLFAIFNAAKEAAAKEKREYYGLTNIDEFIAETFSDPMFQLFLTRQPSVSNKPGSNLLQDFLNAVREMLGVPASQKTMFDDVVNLSPTLFKGKQNVLDKAIDALSGTEYNMVYRGGVDPTGARKILSSIGQTVKDLPAYNSTIAKEVRNATSLLPDNMKALALSFMSLPQKVDLFADRLPILKDLLKILEVRGHRVEELHKEVEDMTFQGINTLQEMTKKYGPQVVNKFNKIGSELSARKIDPRLTESQQTNWDEQLIRAWKNLPEELTSDKIVGEKVVTRIVNGIETKIKLPVRKGLAYQISDRYEEYRQQIIDNIERVAGGNVAADLRKRFEKNKISFYLPLRRKGNYRLAYFDKFGKERTIKHFETPAELERAKEKALKSGATNVQSSLMTRQVNYKETPPLGFVKEVIDTLDKSIESSPEKDDLINEIYKMYLNLFPDDSIRLQIQEREGIPGYIEDIVGGFADTGSRLSLQLSNLEYKPQLDAAFKTLDEQQREFINGNPDKNIPPHDDLKENAMISQVVQDMNGQRKFIENPVADSISAQLSWVSYIWNIAGNVSSAIINLTQVPMVVMPMLGGEYTWNEAYDALSTAYKMYFKGGLFNDNNRNFLPDHTFGAKLKPGDKHYKLYHAALGRSTIRRGIGYELNELRQKSAEDFTGTKAKIYTSLGWIFQNSERMNREVTLIAAYDLEMARLAKKGITGEKAVDAAIEKAIETTTRAHSHALSEAGPKMFQNGIGKVAFTFKRFAQAQIYNMARLFYVATRDMPTKEREIARKQFLGIMGMTYVFSGLQGLPVYGGLNMLSSAIAGMFGDDDEPYDFDEEVREIFGDIGYKGPLNKLLNIDIAARTGFNGMVFHDDPRRLAEVGFGPYFIEHFFGPAYQTLAVNPTRAAKLWDEGHTERAIETLMPSALKNMMKGFRFATEGATTTNGIKIIDDPNALNNLLQVFGFTNADLSEAYTRASSLKKYEKHILDRRTHLLDTYYLAKSNGDTEMMSKIRDDMRTYSSKVPAGIKITEDTISRSTRGHKEREKQARDGVVISKKLKNQAVEEAGA